MDAVLLRVNGLTSLSFETGGVSNNFKGVKTNPFEGVYERLFSLTLRSVVSKHLLNDTEFI